MRDGSASSAAEWLFSSKARKESCLPRYSRGRDLNCPVGSLTVGSQGLPQSPPRTGTYYVVGASAPFGSHCERRGKRDEIVKMRIGRILPLGRHNV